jgi:hypothetical protein
MRLQPKSDSAGDGRKQLQAEMPSNATSQTFHACAGDDEPVKVKGDTQHKIHRQAHTALKQEASHALRPDVNARSHLGHRLKTHSRQAEIAQTTLGPWITEYAC